jgi:hypothetical protein
LQPEPVKKTDLFAGLHPNTHVGVEASTLQTLTASGST